MATAAKTITVGPSATYKTIQSAVNAAVAGDTVLVQSGTYNEVVLVEKAITVKAAPGATPIVDAGQKYPAFRVKAAATIDGFTIRNAGKSYTGVYVTASGATVSNNKISGCGWGIFLTGGSANTVKGNTVDGATTDGIGISGSNRNTVTGNKVTNSAKGLSIEGSSSSNVIYFNDFNNGYSASGVTNTYNSPTAVTYTYKGVSYSHIVGNFWGNYKSTDKNNNGLGDAVYTGNGFKDTYPLIASITNFALGGTGNPDPETDGHSCSDGHAEAHRNPDADRRPLPHRRSRRSLRRHHGYSDAYGYAQAYGHTGTDGHSRTDGNAYGHAEADCNANSD